jgi:hypothetical protein
MSNVASASPDSKEAVGAAAGVRQAEAVAREAEARNLDRRSDVDTGAVAIPGADADRSIETKQAATGDGKPREGRDGNENGKTADDLPVTR